MSDERLDREEKRLKDKKLEAMQATLDASPSDVQWDSEPGAEEVGPATGGSASDVFWESQSERSAEDVGPATGGASRGGGSASDRAMVRIALKDESPDGSIIHHHCVCHPSDAFAWLTSAKSTSSSELLRRVKFLGHGELLELVDAETTWSAGRRYFVAAVSPSRFSENREGPFSSSACDYCAGLRQALETVEEDGDAKKARL